MKNKKAGIAIAVIIVIALIIILYVLSKSKPSAPSGSSTGSGSNSLSGIFSSGNIGNFLQSGFQQVLTGANTNIQSLFNGNVSNGDYNVKLPSYILNGSTFKSTSGSSAPTLDLQYLPKGCTIDSYIAGNC